MSVIDLSMSSPVSDPPESPKPGKRKAESDDEVSHDKGKKAKPNGRIEIKGGKVHLRQDAYQRVLPRRRLLNFEGWLLDTEEAGTASSAIPDEFFDLIVMAGHELSSSSEASFIKSLKAELVKGDSGDTLKNELLTPLVTQLFTLKQYGFQSSDFGVSRIPARLQIRCWEANDLDKYFPAERVSELLARRAEREHAREECERLLAGMSDAEKSEFLKGEKPEKKDGKLDIDPAGQSTPSTFTGPAKDRTTCENSAASTRARSASPSKRSKKLTPADEAEAKKRKEEKEAEKAEKRKDLEAKEAKREEKRKEHEEKKKELEEKRQVREEKKAEKERVQQKKAKVKAKQTSMFSNFFTKTAPPDSRAKTPEAGPSAVKVKVSDFQLMFPPVAQRVNVDWAPINQFTSKPSFSAGSPAAAATWTKKDFLRDHLNRHKLRRHNPRSVHGRGLKSEPLYGTVAQMWSAYQEAEDPRAVLDELTNMRKFPWKTLAFDQQARPPYVGTFTKKSLAVGPRTPFAQDPVFDYSYDSADDWQEDDEGGEDVDEPVDDGDDEAPTEDEGEFDDWLDNTEDPIFSKGADGDIVMAESTHLASPKKRVPVKRITKLNPTWQGPVWEQIIAGPTEGLDEYRIQLLNDTPSTIDPFKYQSSDVLPQFKTTFSDTAVGNQLRVRCLLAAQTTNAPQFAPVQPQQSMPLGDASSAANTTGPKGRNPKVAFPQKHLPEFLRIVDGNTRILTDLISLLKIRFDKVTTKAAIEAKIREVAVREGKSKDSEWKVKPEAWTAAGVAPPVRGLSAAGGPSTDA
ncbi:hypothetical protein CcaverHIS002_0507040 [Cutaneotrichosporon cavernicola]|nr:hypothetical protein CcaverHIS002_0507040 [Cutaneotrichosporon cavernicola]BEJ00906.1 hypothetical protein CcaverHIS631_0507630 [Cutaneotrichosporon cavernicola]BEJ08672.1 hypothetical protein CcaverHIS641_0507660 [Cutaneotrichosporon cavernicola]